MTIPLGLTLALSPRRSGRPTLDLDFLQQRYSMSLIQKAFGDIITFTRASAATRINAAGVLETVGNNVPRIDYDPVTLACRGLLIEEQRTNLVGNSTMVGASAGVWPSGWSQYVNNGLSATVTGVGAAGGLNYVDVRVSGTTTGNAGVWIYISGGGSASASAGQTLSRSLTAAVVNGAMGAGTASYNMEGRASGGVVQETFTGSVSLSSEAQRFSRTNTLANANTVSANVVFFLNWSSTGVVVDVTVRLMAPQLEQGAFATSYIPTAGSQVTRAADVASINTLSPWYNASEGTLFAEYTAVNPQTNIAASLGSGSSDCVAIRQRANPDVIGMVRKAGSGYDAGATVIAVGGTIKSAICYAGGSVSSISVNGGSIRSGAVTPADLTSSFVRLGLGQHGSSTADGTLNGYLRKVRYFPKRLTNAQLQSLTA